jgi:hypothetical protein
MIRAYRQAHLCRAAALDKVFIKIIGHSAENCSTGQRMRIRAPERQLQIIPRPGVVKSALHTSGWRPETSMGNLC